MLVLKPLQILVKGEHAYVKSTAKECNSHAKCR